MEPLYKSTLLKLLDAIDYNGDKETFVKEFTDSVQIHAMDRLISSLTQDKQEFLKTQLKENIHDLDKIGEILKAHFSEEQMKESFEQTTQNAVRDWMKSVDSTLTQTQRQKLLNISYELNFQPHPTNSD